KPLLVLFTAVTLLLLMSIVNVGSLVTTFARGRQHEFAIRHAIGASGSRLVRQQLMQSALLGFAGALIGIGFAFLGSRGLVALAPGSVPRVSGVEVNLAVLLFTSLLSLVTTIAFSLSGAVRAGAGVAPSIAVSSPSRVTSRLRGSRI